jgi:hypothetical protein
LKEELQAEDVAVKRRGAREVANSERNLADGDRVGQGWFSAYVTFWRVD